MATVGTVTSLLERASGRTVKKITWTVVSDGSGNVSGDDATTDAVLDGKVLALHTVPAGGGSAPTDNYDLTILDADGLDVLAGGGANRDTAVTEIVAQASLGAV